MSPPFSHGSKEPDAITVKDKRGTGTRMSGGDNGDEAALTQQEPPPWFPVFLDFEQERLRQLEKWGDQRGHRTDGTGFSAFKDMAAEYQRQNDAREAAGKSGVWSKILLEEVFEALAERDLDKLDYELTQAGAVITAWKEDLAYRKAQVQ